MRAAVVHRYGPPEVVTLETVETPTPRAGEVLVRVHAATVTSADSRLRSLNVPNGFRLLTRLAFGILKPRNPILGSELAGTVVAIGAGVTKFRTGDEVFAFPDAALRCHAEYRTMSESGSILKKPANLSFEQAAAVSFSGTTALYFLSDRAKVERGEKVLVIGASGAVGSALVQLAKHFGAHVTGVCSTRNVELVRSIGADHTIDYTREDFTASSAAFDIVLDTTGDCTFHRCESILVPGGRLVLIAASLTQIVGAVFRRPRSKGRRVIVGVAAATDDMLGLLKELCEKDAFSPLIERTFPLERIREAHALVDSRRKRGSVVISLFSETGPVEPVQV